MNSRPYFIADVIHSENMNPNGRVSEKSGRVWTLYRVHCVLHLDDRERRVCQLINDEPVAPGRYQVAIGLAERDGRAVFQPAGFFLVPAQQPATGKQAVAA